jgi:hypothetical protein
MAEEDRQRLSLLILAKESLKVARAMKNMNDQDDLLSGNVPIKDHVARKARNTDPPQIRKSSASKAATRTAFRHVR